MVSTPCTAGPLRIKTHEWFKSTDAMNAEHFLSFLSPLSHLHLTDMSNDNICRWEANSTNNPEIIGRRPHLKTAREKMRGIDKWTTAGCLLRKLLVGIFSPSFRSRGLKLLPFFIVLPSKVSQSQFKHNIYAKKKVLHSLSK